MFLPALYYNMSFDLLTWQLTYNPKWWWCSYLQCTTTGAVLSGLYMSILCLYVSKGVGCNNAPWSLQEVKWNCFTDRLVSFLKRNTLDLEKISQFMVMAISEIFVQGWSEGNLIWHPTCIDFITLPIRLIKVRTKQVKSMFGVIARIRFASFVRKQTNKNISFYVKIWNFFRNFGFPSFVSDFIGAKININWALEIMVVLIVIYCVV